MIELGIVKLREKIKSKEVSSAIITSLYIDEIKKSNLNAVIEVFEDALQNAKEMDKKIAKGYDGKLAGVPIIIKDNILIKGKHASAGSKMLQDYVAEYTSTVAKRLLNEGAIIIGRANMDEFAMGSGTETSFYGKTLNPYDNSRVPGGSSGGSAVSVAANLCSAALGTDTGGSIRQPSSFCGCVGMKPTYGRVSRYGVIAYASSLDQVGPITKNVEDNALLMEILAGKDDRDATSSNIETETYTKYLNQPINGLKIGVIKQVNELVKGLEVERLYQKTIGFLRDKGAIIQEVNIDDLALSLPVYYIIATAEASSNLARYDGVKYSYRATKTHNLDDIYCKSRSEGFGEEVKRRIMLGNYVLSSGYYDAYYNKAKALQTRLKKEYSKTFEMCDAIIMPTTLGEAYKIGEKALPIDAYKEDIFTVSANIVGIPALSINVGMGTHNLPIGMQLLAKPFGEGVLYKIADNIEKYLKK